MEPMDLLNYYIGLNPLGKALQEGLDYYTSETIKPEVKKDSVDTAPATTSVSTSAGNEPKKQDLPTGGVSGGDITALLGALIQAQKEEAAQAREYYPQKAAID